MATDAHGNELVRGVDGHWYNQMGQRFLGGTRYDDFNSMFGRIQKPFHLDPPRNMSPAHRVDDTFIKVGLAGVAGYILRGYIDKKARHTETNSAADKKRQNEREKLLQRRQALEKFNQSKNEWWSNLPQEHRHKLTSNIRTKRLLYIAMTIFGIPSSFFLSMIMVAAGSVIIGNKLSADFSLELVIILLITLAIIVTGYILIGKIDVYKYSVVHHIERHVFHLN